MSNTERRAPEFVRTARTILRLRRGSPVQQDSFVATGEFIERLKLQERDRIQSQENRRAQVGEIVDRYAPFSRFIRRGIAWMHGVGDEGSDLAKRILITGWQKFAPSNRDGTEKIAKRAVEDIRKRLTDGLPKQPGEKELLHIFADNESKYRVIGQGWNFSVFFVENGHGEKAVLKIGNEFAVVRAFGDPGNPKYRDEHNSNLETARRIFSKHPLLQRLIPEPVIVGRVVVDEASQLGRTYIVEPFLNLVSSHALDSTVQHASKSSQRNLAEEFIELFKASQELVHHRDRNGARLRPDCLSGGNITLRVDKVLGQEDQLHFTIPDTGYTDLTKDHLLTRASMFVGYWKTMAQWAWRLRSPLLEVAQEKIKGRINDVFHGRSGQELLREKNDKRAA